MIYYSRMKESKISKRKSHMKWSLEEAGSRFSVCLPKESLRDGANRDNRWNVWQDASVTKIFSGGWSDRHTLPNMCQNTRLPKGKEVYPQSILETSLVVQWESVFCNARGVGWIPGQGAIVIIGSHRPRSNWALVPQLLRLLTTTGEPVHLNKRSHVMQQRSCVQQLRPRKAK